MTSLCFPKKSLEKSETHFPVMFWSSKRIVVFLNSGSKLKSFPFIKDTNKAKNRTFGLPIHVQFLSQSEDSLIERKTR